MRYGYWLPVFGGWLRNVDDEQMEATWEYNSRLARRSEEIGYDLTLIAELNLNDIKGVEAPSLDAWSTAAALAAVTSRLELMVAVRPTFHQPALLAKQAANIDQAADFQLREMNRSFVQMQYFGYLRRNPNDTPDLDFAGYDFWLNKLNLAGGNFIQAEMVKAFLQSGEYRRRFGP